MKWTQKMFIMRILLLALISQCLVMPVQAVNDDFGIIKDRVVAELMKTPIDDSQVKTLLARIRADGSFSGINYDDLTRVGGFPHRNHTAYLVYIAKAYRTPSSRYFQNPLLKEKIDLAFKHWVDHDYVGDNWHDNQITTPTNLVNLMLIIGKDLAKDQVDQAQPMIGRANMNASGARPSGDKIVIASILAKNLLFLGDGQRFDEIIKLIEGEIKFSTGQRGMQHDYSFHHRKDRVNNTTSYGYGKYANTFGEWSYYVANTKYAFSKDGINHLVDYYLDGICKQLVYGIYTDVSVKNRSITRESGFGPKGITEVERLLFGTKYRSDELEEILKLRKGEIKPSHSFCKFFWQTEHFVVQRPHYYTTVRMFSTRNRNMEVGYNGEGKPTHHRADGTNHLMLTGDEYHGIWPLYDWQKIPGTTILQKPELHKPNQVQKAGLRDFVGAVTDGHIGAVAFDFKSPHDSTEAKKSWFFFEDEYVCLGSAINSDRNLPVVTTVNQVRMRSDVTVKQAHELRDLPHGNRKLDTVEWIHHDDIGYLFPQPTTIHISNQTQQGRWSDITDQKGASKKLLSEDIFMLWFDHGIQPKQATYAYIVVPNISVSDFEKTVPDKRGIEIISNTPALQAVKHNTLKVCQAVFYEVGDLTISETLRLQSLNPGIIMIKKQSEDRIQLTVSDPSRKLEQMQVTLSSNYSVEKGNALARPNHEENSTRLIIDLPQGVYAGKSTMIHIKGIRL